MKCLAELNIAKKSSRCLSVASTMVDESKRFFFQRHWLWPVSQRLKRDERGTTAVEFALIALPFLLTLLAVFEFGSEFVFQTALDEATTDSSRQIRTGALQSTGTGSPSSMAAAICSNLKFASSGCTGKLSVDVRVFQSLSAVSTPNPFSSGALDPAQLSFQLGGPGNIVLVTTYYQWTVFVPGLSQFMTPLNNGQIVIKSTVAFRNEPYG